MRYEARYRKRWRHGQYRARIPRRRRTHLRRLYKPGIRVQYNERTTTIRKKAN